MPIQTTVIRAARPRDAAGIARVETETWRDAYPALLPRDFLVQGSGSKSNWAQRLRGKSRNVLVAEAGTDHICAYATWGPNTLQHGRSGAAAAVQLFELYVDADHREQGIGRRLCADVAECAVISGKQALYVEVLDGNPSRYFYEALGAKLVASAEHELRGQRFPTLIYRWDDLKILAC